MRPVIYIVFAYGGEYEDSWEQPLRAYFNKEKAEEFAKKYNEWKNRKADIPKDEFAQLLDKLYEYEEEHDVCFDSEYDGLIFIQNKYSKEQIEDALMIYDYTNDYSGTEIKEVELYDSND